MRTLIIMLMALVLVGSVSAFFPFTAYAPDAYPGSYYDYYTLRNFVADGDRITGAVIMENLVYHPVLPDFGAQRGPMPELFFDPPPPKARGMTFCQAYGLNGPFPIAELYGKPVWVAYKINRERYSNRRPERFARTMRGTASVYTQPGCTGYLIDQGEFRSTESWRDEYAENNWPARWWQPDVKQLYFSVTIEGIGKFVAQKRGSYWLWKGENYGSRHLKRKDQWRVY